MQGGFFLVTFLVFVVSAVVFSQRLLFEKNDAHNNRNEDDMIVTINSGKLKGKLDTTLDTSIGSLLSNRHNQRAIYLKRETWSII